MNTDKITNAGLVIAGITFFGSLVGSSQADNGSKLTYLEQRKAITEEKQPAKAPGSGEKSSTLSDLNKVSHLLGAEVRDQRNEKLGEISDLVIDLKNGEVAYAVLSVDEGFLNLGEKLFAVPLQAFIQLSDVDYLYLYTDREKLSKAKGFDKENWPDIESPVWGAEPFWQRDAEETGAEKSSRDAAE